MITVEGKASSLRLARSILAEEELPNIAAIAKAIKVLRRRLQHLRSLAHQNSWTASEIVSLCVAIECMKREVAR